MSYDINSQQVDIENLFKQNANDLSSIKELYRKLKEIEEKISQIKHIDTKLTDKLKKDYEKLKRIILDENIQAKLTNDINEIDTSINNINNDIKEIDMSINNINNDIKEIDTQIDIKANEVDLKILESRMDNFTSLPDQSVTTVGDVELIDGRVGFLGETYNNIGDSIRKQYNLIVANSLLSYRTVDLSNTILGYINSQGTLINDSAYRTDVINLEKDETILIYANGYSTNVSIISMKKGDTYTPLVVSTDNNFRWFQYTANENMSIILSFVDRDKCKAIIIKKPNILEKNKIDKSLFGVETKTTGFINDCYINKDGSKLENTNSWHVMSEEITLKKGDVIYVETKEENNNVSVFSKVNGDNYIPLVISNANSYEYRYEATENMKVVISAPQSWNKTYTIFNKFNAKQIEEVNEKADIIFKFLGYNKKVINSYTDDCFIYKDGSKSINTNSWHIMSEEITLKKGDTIYVETKEENDNVSVFSKVNGDNYIPLVISNANSYEYRYEATENMKVVISAPQSWNKIYYVFNKTLNDNDNDNETIIDFTPSFSMFEKFGVIGDSFASGEVAINGYIDYYNVSWGQILARMSGNKCINFSSGGLSTRTWLTHEKGLKLLNSTEPQQLYICALGINDYDRLGESYLGNIADIQTKADTFYGNYGKIIEAVKTKAPNAKIIMLTTTEITDIATKYNNAIINIANHYKIPYLVQNDDPFFATSFYRNNMVNGHPLAVVYSSMAKTFRRMIEKCMYDNLSYFRDFIG